MIKKFSLIANVNAQIFTDDLNKEIDKLQFEGYELELQYSTNESYFSALVIARKPKQIENK